MNTISKIEQPRELKPKFSNLSDQDLRLKINKEEELLAQLENKPGKSNEEFKQLVSIKEKLKLLLQQSTIPYRLTNTVWFNRLDSIFFSIKNNPAAGRTAF